MCIFCVSEIFWSRTSVQDVDKKGFHAFNAGPEEDLDLELTLSGSSPGKITHSLLCYIHHQKEPLTLYVEAEIKVKSGMQNRTSTAGKIRSQSRSM